MPLATALVGKQSGKRQSGMRLAAEPPVSAAAQVPNPPKTKKSLPFLKNPMSTLLMRRKASQPIPNVVPIPLANRRDERKLNDPSIRGTRVHDFSIPKSQRMTSSIHMGPSPISVTASGPPLPGPTGYTLLEGPPMQPIGLPTQSDRPSDTGDLQTSQMRSKNSVSASSQESQVTSPPAVDGNGAPRPLSLERKPVPSKTGSLLAAKDSTCNVSSLPSTVSKTASVDAVSVLAKSTPSTTSTASRHASTSERSMVDITGPSPPKHMKSTSSRFSFDMIGAAKQEKLLEERHRQKQQEHTCTVSADHDSTCYDFDQDRFDYDAMEFDDGLEERIPGVNADLDEDDGIYEEEIPGIDAESVDDVDENDPDNDQENFAGFVFQRSNPASSLASPLSPPWAITPRDADGKVIGFAMTEDASDSNQLSPDFLPEIPGKSPQETEILGLGIQGLDSIAESQDEATQGGETLGASPTLQPYPPEPDDELYFDNGMHEFDGENIDGGGGEPFDESLFDLDDTDQYGRPLPGVFAKAQSMRQSQVRKQQESDGTCRLSAFSAVSESTSHTSCSGAAQLPGWTDNTLKEKTVEEESGRKSPEKQQDLSSTQEEQIAAYQAALAAAAHEAAAQGKFLREPSPPPAEATATSPTTNMCPQHDMARPDALDGDYDGFNHDFDDYDLDDDAMVAEANASVLANDSDGFYGQEFGFYSTPLAQNHHHGPCSALNAENLYQYANGGYFGPSGVKRTTSGRMVSREPNLTPITERSEYSNRNSVMSGMGMPPLGGMNTMVSPGLAQLAALASDEEEDDTMSLSALLKLRSKAWGGSQASLVSSREGGSPLSDAGREGAVSPWGSNSGLGGLGGVGAVAGAGTSEVAAAAAAAGLRVHSPDHIFAPATVTTDSPSRKSQSSPAQAYSTVNVGAGGLKRAAAHHRKRGSADSISYTKEKEAESGETR